MLELNGQREVGGGDWRARQALKGVRSSKKSIKDVVDAHAAYSFSLQLKKNGCEHSRWVRAALVGNEEMRGPAAGRIQASKGLRVKARERSRDGCGETELEQNCRRNEREQQRCSTSGWQHFHLSNQSTHPPHSHQLFCQAGCLSAALCTRAIFTHFLHPVKLYFFQHTHTVCTLTQTHISTHSRCLTVSVFPSGEWALQLRAKKCR